MLENRMKFYLVAVTASLFFYASAFLMGSALSIFSITTFAYGTALALVMIIASVSVLQILVYGKFRVISFYFGIFQAITFFLLALVSFPGTLFTPFLLAMILEILALLLISGEIKGITVRASVAVISLAVMIYLGDLFQFAFNRPDTGFIVASTESVFVALGQNIPFLEYNGLFIYTHHFDLILSIQQYIMFMALAILISENYYQIIRYVSGHGRKDGRASMLIYGLTGALSCQCESYISFLPALSILLINYVLFPVIVFSILLLAGTYLIVSRRYSRGISLAVFSSSSYSNRKILTLLAGFLILMGTPVFITIVVYLSLLQNALYFFLTGMIMILDGFVIMLLISMIFSFPRLNGKAGLVLVSLGTFLSLIWFYPALTKYAFDLPPYFVLMNSSMLASGIIYGFVHSFLNTKWKDVLKEYISTLYGIFSILIFYVMATFQVSLWPFFSIESQIEFSLITWTIMLPVMWVTTQVSLNRIVSARASVPTPEIYT